MQSAELYTTAHLDELLPTYLVDCPEGHDEDGDEEVGDGQAEDEVVGHVLQVPLQQDGGDHEHVA